MTTAIASEFTAVENRMYSYSAITRLLPELQHTQIQSRELQQEYLVVNTNDGSIKLERNELHKHFIEYRNRLPNFFDYKGPTYQSRLSWYYGFSILPISQHCAPSHPKNPIALVQQQALVNTKAHIKTFQGMERALCGTGSRLGYLTTAHGLTSQPPDTNLPLGIPLCTCGDYQFQSQNLSELRQLIGSSFQPSCKHIAALRSLEELRNRLSEMQLQQEQSRQFKSLAYWFKPSHDPRDPGLLKALFIEDQPQMPIDGWSLYNKGGMSSDKTWEFFHTALDHGFAIYHAYSLPSLQTYLRRDQRLSESREEQLASTPVMQ